MQAAFDGNKILHSPISSTTSPPIYAGLSSNCHKFDAIRWYLQLLQDSFVLLEALSLLYVSRLLGDHLECMELYEVEMPQG
nr:hypothetical protein CFP56_79354 [Quercus suber]